MRRTGAVAGGLVFVTLLWIAPAGAQDVPVTHIDTDELIVALTLDDGYRPSEEVISYIEEEGLPGTAFLVGQVADDDPDLVRRIDAMGWQVCSHTYGHANLSRMSADEIREEITRGADAIEDVVGYRCPYFRAPFGATNEDVMAIADELGLEVIGWDASLSDSSPGVSESDQLRVARNDLHPGSILLGHWGGVHSFSVLSQVIEGLREDGYRIVDVDELLNGPEATVEPAVVAMPKVEIAVDAPSDERSLAVDWRRFGVASAPGGTILAFTAALAIATRRTSRRRLEMAMAVSRSFDGT